MIIECKDLHRVIIYIAYFVLKANLPVIANLTFTAAEPIINGLFKQVLCKSNSIETNETLKPYLTTFNPSEIKLLNKLACFDYVCKGIEGKMEITNEDIDVASELIRRFTNVDIKSICIINNPKDLEKIIDGVIQDKGIKDIANKYLPDLKNQICRVAPPPVPIPIPKAHRKRLILITFAAALILYGIGLALGFLLFSNRKMWIITWSIFMFVLVLIIFLWNPLCAYRNCLKSGQEFKPVPGIYEGSKTLGDMTASGKAELIAPNKIRILELKCSGKYCPPEIGNITKLCNDILKMPADTPLEGTIDLSTKSKYGYRVVSPCLDKIYETKNRAGVPILGGVWVAYENGKYSLQLNFNPCIDLFNIGCLSLYVPIELKRVSS